jgi:hypothetical protein
MPSSEQRIAATGTRTESLEFEGASFLRVSGSASQIPPLTMSRAILDQMC